MVRKPAIQIDFLGNALIGVEVHPNSSRSGITGYNVWRDRLQISTKALAIKGEANKELIGILSTSFGLQNSQIEIVSGITNRFKQIKLCDIELESINKVISEIIEGE
jgi:uncharacterized protein (TIGR00251 family)